jgi:hypothetical protein
MPKITIENQADDGRARRCGHNFNLRECPYRHCDARRLSEMVGQWAAFAKAMRLYQSVNGELSDYDDELASDVFEVAKSSLDWRDDPEYWNNVKLS